jgi:hypothetical protein
VSYGEDYAATLRICREYRIGRIYESFTYAGDGEGNRCDVDNRGNEPKWMHSKTDSYQEIRARQEINKGVNRMNPETATVTLLFSAKNICQIRGSEGSSSLSGHCLSLLSEQRKSWQGLRDA